MTMITNIVNTIKKENGNYINVYKNANEEISYVMENTFAKNIKKVVSCDKNGTPYKLEDFSQGGIDVYTSTNEGLTVLENGKGRNILSHLSFASLCEKFLK